MSLPTPPGTSHRDEKDNRGHCYSRVVSWSETARYHPITASPPRLSARRSALKAGPSRSILKKIDHPPFPPEEPVKEQTPEPEDPLTNLDYLDHPIQRIIALDASLRDTISAYNSLAARLRNCVTGSTDADASWPLFQPLRKHREALVGALVRDLRQVFVDPLEGTPSVLDSPSTPIQREPMSMSSLPSPRDSPKKKKKRGMSAEQVTRARDLCCVCHAAMRLLSVVFTLPSLCNVFEDEELGFIFTQVLAIPLANELPTPNARKTCALAIWLIQTQRLPAEVLEPAKDRIALALRRGIDGELGKEGKKGSATDGLKAIHDLALYQPAIFVPAFAPIVGSVMENLLAPTLVIRNQACHALGGLALAVASLPPSEALTRISTTVAARLTKSPDPSATTPTKRKLDSSPSKDPALVRTLRTTLQATDPKHAAQGPVWAFSVIAHLVVLLGPTIYLHMDLTRTVIALFSLGMRHPKSSVRGLGCLAWRAMTWAYFRPPHVRLTIDADTDGEDDSATEDDITTERREFDEALRSAYKYLPSLVDMGAGIGLVGALLGIEIFSTQVFDALRILRTMSRKGGQTCKDALDVTRYLLSSASIPDETTSEKEWDHRKLLVPDFFSANPGLLTAEWKTLSSDVKSLIEQCPHVTDMRTLTLDEITAPGLWEEFLAIWKDGLAVLRLKWGSEEVPVEIREIWFNLLKCHAAAPPEHEDQDNLSELALCACDVLVSILDDETLDFTMRKEEVGEILTSPVKLHGQRKKRGLDEPLPESRCNYAIKIFLVRDLFTITRAVFPAEAFAELAESLLKYLNAHEETLVDDVQCTDAVREQWACICAEAAFACEPSVMQAFWDNTLRKGQRDSEWDSDVRALVWQVFLERWLEQDQTGPSSWDTAAVLLCAPFVHPSGWNITRSDFQRWDAFLRSAINAALDQGMDTASLVDQLAGTIAVDYSPLSLRAQRLADLLLSNLDIASARKVPVELMEFTNATIYGAYPPEPTSKMVCMWLLRSLTRVIDACSREQFLPMLEMLVDGITVWVTDDYQICSEEEYSTDILPLYQTILVYLQSLPPCVHVLHTVAPILVAPFRVRIDKHAGAVEAFAEYWQATFAELPEPPMGYPEQVVQCLDAVAQARLEEQEDEAKVEDMTVPRSHSATPSLKEASIAGDDPMAVDSEECESEDEGSVVIPSPDTLSRMSGPRSWRVAPLGDVTLPRSPTTPKASPHERSLLQTTPRRPQKSAVKDHLIGTSSSPPKFSLHSSPSRTPTTPKRSPAKGSDKENASPMPRLETVAERLAARSPLLLASILGKRSRHDDGEEADGLGEKALKRGRLEASPLAPSTFSNVQVHRVELEDVTMEKPELAPPAPEPSTEDVNSVLEASPTISARKRKGVFVDAVEVPSVQRVLRNWRRPSMSPIPREASPPPTCTPSPTLARSPSPDSEPEQSVVRSPQLTIRRTRSATKLLGDRADFQRLPYTPDWKRKATRARQLREEAAQMSSPLRSLRDAPLFGSDDSIMVASPRVGGGVSDLPPSDDEPHVGQVTPHRLVSPALRRVQHIVFNSSDPPSDDSDMSNSPTSERVIRKIVRRGGERFTPKPTPLGVRPRASSVASSSSSGLESD